MPDLCHRHPFVYTEPINYTRWRLGELCNGYGFGLRRLAERGVLLWDRPRQAITFVENHDVVRYHPIVHDKLLVYAVHPHP